MINEHGVSAITVRREELLATLRKNRDEHRAIFEKAQVGYRKAVIEELDRMLAEARDGKRIRRSVELVEPMDRTADYLRVIRALEMSVSDTVTLSEQEFSNLVMDEWSWKAQFTTSNSGYLR